MEEESFPPIPTNNDGELRISEANGRKAPIASRLLRISVAATYFWPIKYGARPLQADGAGRTEFVLKLILNFLVPLK